MNKKNKFLQKAVQEEDGNDYLIPDNEFNIGDWHFRVIQADEPYEVYPKYIRMIANNDQKYRCYNFIRT